MKDIISALSGLIALIVSISCIVNGHSLESTLIRTLISFVASNFIGYIALGLSVVTMYRHSSEKSIKMSSNKDTSKKAPLNA